MELTMTELEAFQSENKALKDVISRLTAENTAMNQSYREEITKKDQLRTLAVHYETVIQKLEAEITSLKAQVLELTNLHVVKEEVA
jgi:hypothetical protein